MQITAELRSELGAFIRARREMLSPRQLGLPAQGRRRTPGLRREEVAQLAGLSTTWYTWLEQGRDMSMSANALSRLADVLALSGAERDYLFQLSRHRDPRTPALSNLSELPASLRTIVDMVPAPAYVIDRLWHAQCWNKAAADLLGPWLMEAEKNLLRFMFFAPSARSLITDWEERSRRVIAEFRADTAHMPDDRDAAALIAELKEGSADFVRLWGDHRVLAREGGLRAFDHPGRGRIEAEQVTFAPIGYPDHKLVILLPAEAM